MSESTRCLKRCKLRSLLDPIGETNGNAPPVAEIQTETLSKGSQRGDRGPQTH